jgi:hypothetical protein
MGEGGLSLRFATVGAAIDDGNIVNRTDVFV